MVASDDQEFLRMFNTPGSGYIHSAISGECDLPNDDAVLCGMYAEQAAAQIPAEVRSAVRQGADYKVFALEECGVKLRPYGIPSYANLTMENFRPLDESLLRAEIVYLRLEFALAEEGLRLSGNFNSDLYDDRQLLSLNQSLFSTRRSPILIAVNFYEGCGAGANFVRLLSAQTLDSLSAIPAFYYDLCVIEGVFPWDMSSCPGVVPNPQVLSSGVWRYRASLSGCAIEGSFDTEFLDVNQSTSDAEFNIPTPSC
ncbi:hypothetical protein ACMA5I_10800 [Paracoccaceae bacterium GXU_MW_L88]